MNIALIVYRIDQGLKRGVKGAARPPTMSDDDDEASYLLFIKKMHRYIRKGKERGIDVLSPSVDRKVSLSIAWEVERETFLDSDDDADDVAEEKAFIRMLKEERTKNKKRKNKAEEKDATLSRGAMEHATPMAEGKPIRKKGLHPF